MILRDDFFYGDDFVMKKQLSVMCDKDVCEMFQRLYPQCMTRFIELALRLACNDKELFMKIFFDEIGEK